MINWTVVGQQVDNTSDIRRSTTAVYRTDRQALSTARFCRAGQLATIDTRCYIGYLYRRLLDARAFHVITLLDCSL